MKMRPEIKPLARYVVYDALMNGFIQIVSGFVAGYICVFIWAEHGFRGLDEPDNKRTRH
jgi:hypothetical protein